MIDPQKPAEPQVETPEDAALLRAMEDDNIVERARHSGAL